MGKICRVVMLEALGRKNVPLGSEKHFKIFSHDNTAQTNQNCRKKSFGCQRKRRMRGRCDVNATHTNSAIPLEYYYCYCLWIKG